MSEIEHTALKDQADQSILTAVVEKVVEKDAIVYQDEQLQEKTVELHLKEMVSLQGEFSPGTLIIKNVEVEKVHGDLSALTKGASIRLTTDLLPPTTRSMPPIVDGQYIKEITVLD